MTWSPVGAVVALVGAGAIVIGSIMPWVSATTIFGTINISGTQGDGVISLIAGLAAGLIAVMGVAKVNVTVWRFLALLAGVAAAATGMYDATNVSRAIGDAPSGIVASVGPGLYFVIVGGVLVVVGSLITQKESI